MQGSDPIQELAFALGRAIYVLQTSVIPGLVAGAVLCPIRDKHNFENQFLGTFC